jgi:hypothetical protein
MGIRTVMQNVGQMPMQHDAQCAEFFAHGWRC